MSEDIFISYSSKDRDQVREFAEKLRGAGFSVWMDEAGIDAAFQWSEAIVDALDGCKVLVLMATKTSFDSVNVVKELSIASESRKHILPIYLEPLRPPASMRYQLAGIQHVELFDAADEEAFDSVVRSLDRLGLERKKPAQEGRGELERMLLTFEEGGSRRRLFLIGKDVVGFGKAKKKGLPAIDITTRLLPLRSAELDPENWKYSRLLSSHHGNFAYHAPRFFIEDLSMNGIYVHPSPNEGVMDSMPMMTFRQGTVRTSGVEPVHAATVKPQEEGGQRISQSYPVSGHLMFALGKNLLHLEARVMQDEGAEEPRALHVLRVNNQPETSYLQLLDGITLGAAPGADLAILDGVEGDALARIRRGAEGYLLSRVQGDVQLDERPLGDGEEAMLEGEMRIGLGGKALEFGPATDADFVAS